MFVVIGVMVMLTEPSWDIFGSVAFFSLCLTVFIHEHLQGYPCLRLDYGGFTWGLGTYQEKVPWTVVERFFVADCEGRKVVGWRYLPNTCEYEQRYAVRGSIRGVHGSFYYTYGKKPEHLVELMNELCRCHHMTVEYLEPSHGA